MNGMSETKGTWTIIVEEGDLEGCYEVPAEVGELFKTVSEERDYYKDIVENVVFGDN